VSVGQSCRQKIRLDRRRNLRAPKQCRLIRPLGGAGRHRYERSRSTIATGYPELDARAERWMKKWRFKPQTLIEVQLPMFFIETYR